jgi:hypothetical protein
LLPPPEEELCELDVLELEVVGVDELVAVAVAIEVVEAVSVVDGELDFDEEATGFKNVVLDAPDEIALISISHLLSRNGSPLFHLSTGTFVIFIRR